MILESRVWFLDLNLGFLWAYISGVFFFWGGDL